MIKIRGYSEVSGGPIRQRSRGARLDTGWIEELHAAGRSPADLRMAGWCHGPGRADPSVGDGGPRTGRQRHRERCLLAAERAAAPHGSVPTLCCGLAGHAYALLIAHQLTGDVHWLARAENLAWHGVREAGSRSSLPNSLWRGDVGLALLIHDQELPDRAALALFAPEGWQRLTPAAG
jgi:hypothetical protein